MPKSLFPAASETTRAQLEQDPGLKLLNEYDWSSNPLGEIPGWSDSLRGAVRVMMASSMPMVLLIGEDGILIYNTAYAEFAGDRHPAIFGLPATEAWPEIADFNREKIAMGLRGDSLTLRDQELILNRHGQLEAGWMDLNYSPILGDDGVPLGTICLVHEITDRKLAEQALARSEERLSLALSGSELVGTWDWEVPIDRLTADDTFARLSNLDPLRAGLGVEVEQFFAAIHPDDVARVREAVDLAVHNGQDYRCEYRVTGSDGKLHWVLASGRARLGADGAAERFPGVVVDLTEQRRVSEALAESEMQFRTLADTMPQMVWSSQADGHHDYYNARWREFSGASADTTQGDDWRDLLHPEDQQRVVAAWQHSLTTAAPFNIEARLRRHDGDYRWVLGLALPVRDADGAILRWFGTYTDIHDSRLAAEERELVAQELSHRIKNIFAVLTGIIGLSARSRPDIKDYADDLRQRIYALGEAHDFVRPDAGDTANEARNTSFKALTNRLLRPYQEGDAERVEFMGDDAEIDDGAATPLGLIIHELATNAVKYGALSVTEGKVILSGHLGDSYHLSWKELGGPALAGDPASDGFGARLIALSLEGQLRGKVERIWEPDGLRVEMEMPLKALRRSAKLVID